MRKKCNRVVRPIYNISAADIGYINGQMSDDECGMQMLPLLCHIEEVKHGFGFAKSVEVITVYLNAMIVLSKLSDSKSSGSAFGYMREAAESWIECAEKSHSAGIDGRIVMTAEALSKISRAIRLFFVILPTVSRKKWVETAERCRIAWDKSCTGTIANSQKTN